MYSIHSLDLEDNNMKKVILIVNLLLIYFFTSTAGRTLGIGCTILSIIWYVLTRKNDFSLDIINKQLVRTINNYMIDNQDEKDILLSLAFVVIAMKIATLVKIYVYVGGIVLIGISILLALVLINGKESGLVVSIAKLLVKLFCFINLLYDWIAEKMAILEFSIYNLKERRIGLKIYNNFLKKFIHIVNFLNIKKFFSKLYNIISILSTLLIFSGIIWYAYGHIVKNNQSDNDLIMDQIKEEIGEDKIIAIDGADIHGFGSNSIIVTTHSAELGLNQPDNNNLLILDSINNELLKDMNDLLGRKSNYKVTFSYNISSKNIRFLPRTEYVLDIIGDSTKELIVKYYIWGSTYGGNGTAIFEYSYDEEKYKIIGTYPENKKINTRMYDESGDLIGFEAKKIKTVFKDKSITDKDVGKAIMCKSGKEEFNLNNGSGYNQEYWVRGSSMGTVLATVNNDKYGKKETYINIYQPLYDNKELSWNLVYSENVDDFPRWNEYSKDDLAKALIKIMDCRVSIIDPYYEEPVRY